MMKKNLLISRPVGTSWWSLARLGVALAMALCVGQVSSVAAATNQVLKVGINYIPPPPGPAEFRLYTPESFEVLLAERVAGRLGKRLELVQLRQTETVAALDRREVDIVLAKLSPNDPLARRAAVIPSGFMSGATVAMRTDTDISDWKDLAGRTVCLSRGNEAAEALARRNGATIRVEDAPARSLVHVRTGVCDAAIHDEILLERLFREENWQKFSATLPPSLPLRLSAVVDADDEALAEAIEIALADMASPRDWDELRDKWARNVAFEVYLDQDAPDCH